MSDDDGPPDAAEDADGGHGGHHGPHLDVLVEDEYAEFVADGLEPDIVVGAFKDHITLGIDSRDGAVDVYVGNLSAEAARELASMLSAAADAVESPARASSGRTWVLGEGSED